MSGAAAARAAVAAGADASLRLLTFTNLYPNAEQPSHGVFVEQRLRHVLATGEATATVIAPVPWFPLPHRAFGRYGAFARVPREEQRHGVRVLHPRHPVIPKVGMSLAPALMERAVAPVIERLLAGGARFDLIDAHYFYPDGVAAAGLARRFGLPLTITARGSDVNVIARYPRPRRMIVEAARRSAAVITVCQALADRLVELGAPAGKISVLRNGVDLELFRPQDRDAARARFGVDGYVLLSVGTLSRAKGHDRVIEAVARLPGAMLLIAGAGPEEALLRQCAREAGVADRVRFLGLLPHDQLAHVYTAADAFVLASEREGLANVVLESMACGTPVVVSRVGGLPEVVDAPEAGMVLETRTAEAISAALTRLRAAGPAREATRRHAERFGWQQTTRGQLELFARIAARRGDEALRDDA